MNGRVRFDPPPRGELYDLKLVEIGHAWELSAINPTGTEWMRQNKGLQKSYAISPGHVYEVIAHIARCGLRLDWR